MKHKKTIVMMSHLSDAQIEIANDPQLAHKRINFVKMLILDERTELSNDELNELWEEL